MEDASICYFYQKPHSHSKKASASTSHPCFFMVLANTRLYTTVHNRNYQIYNSNIFMALAWSVHRSEILNRLLKSISQIDFRLPAKYLFCLGDIWPSYLGVVLRKVAVYDI
jgi:hypothetical protein